MLRLVKTWPCAVLGLVLAVGGGCGGGDSPVPRTDPAVAGAWFLAFTPTSTPACIHDGDGMAANFVIENVTVEGCDRDCAFQRVSWGSAPITSDIDGDEPGVGAGIGVLDNGVTRVELLTMQPGGVALYEIGIQVLDDPEMPLFGFVNYIDASGCTAGALPDDVQFTPS